MVRKKCFEKVSMFDESLPSAEDYDLWLRLSTHCDFALIPKVLVHKRNHGSNIGSNMEKSFTSQIKAFQKIISLHSDIIEKEHIDFSSRFIEIYNMLGYFYFKRNDFVKARENYLLSLSHLPNKKQCYIGHHLF